MIQTLKNRNWERMPKCLNYCDRHSRNRTLKILRKPSRPTELQSQGVFVDNTGMPRVKLTEDVILPWSDETKGGRIETSKYRG